MKKYFLRELGCYCSEIDAERIRLFLKKNGWVPAADPKGADLAVIVTCAFNTNSEDNCIKAIGQYKALMPKKSKLIVGGCLPVINKPRMLSVYDGPYFTPYDMSPLAEMIGASRRGIEEMPTSQEVRGKTGIFACREDKAFGIRIGWGCLSRCSYCVVNKVFPKLISKSVDQVIREFKSGLKQGHTNFLLTGEDTSAYGRDIGTNLAELLEDLIKIKTEEEISLYLVRLSPRWLLEMGSRFFNTLKSRKIKALSITVSSGSPRVLKLMNRKYDSAKLKEYIQKIKREFPFIKFCFDFMVGFPGETEEDFQMTLKFASEIRPDNTRIFPYTDRPGAPSTNFPDRVPQEITNERARRLGELFGALIIGGQNVYEDKK